MVNEDQNKNYFKVPMQLLSVLTFMIVQTFAAGWWASSMTAKVDFMGDQISTTIKDRYTSNDANKDWVIRDARIIKVESDIDRLKEIVYSLIDDKQKNNLNLKGRSYGR